MSEFLCGVVPFRKKLEGDKDLSTKDRENIANKMARLASDFDTGVYKNIKDAGYNNADTFQWLFRKYTKLPSMSPSEFPVNYKHVKLFEMGLKYYDTLLAKPKGIFASKFHLPRRAMQNMPELQKFEKNLSNETSFFRDYTNNSNKNVAQFLDAFNDFVLETGQEGVFKSKILGKDKIPLTKLYNDYRKLQSSYLKSTNTRQKESLSKQLRENRSQLLKFYSTGAGDAFGMMNEIMQGVNISTLENKDGSKLTVKQRAAAEQMRQNYIQIRKAGALGLVRGLQKIKKMAKEKNLNWADKAIERVDGLIKNIEFQKSIDESGRTIEHSNLIGEREFLALGFRTSDISNNKKLSLSKHYMSQYSLGLVTTMKNLQKDVEDGRMTLSQKVEAEINNWDEIINVAKGKSPLANPVYDNDPYFFLKKYVSDVGIFNYKLHVKDNFSKATKSIINEHLIPAEKAGRADLVESASSMVDVINDVYQEVRTVDPNRDGFFENAMRTMQAVTYFRLMGGNVRSAARNATQRAYEWIEFGFKASKIDAPKFYKNDGRSEENNVALTRQKKKYGLQWFDGNTRTSNLFESFKGKDMDISQKTRGAMEDAYMNDKDVYIDEKGELQVKDGETWHAKTARSASAVAAKTSGLHKWVEDWNRSKTFKVAFALASQNLRLTSEDWRSRQILKKFKKEILKEKGSDYVITKKDLVEKYGKDADKTMDSWIENRAGEIAYGGVLDLHFEYAKWNKAKAIRVTGNESKATAIAKMGIGQFAHYRFEMMGLMHKWITEAGLNPRRKVGAARAGDFMSEEFMRPIRFGILQALIWGVSVVGRTNLQKLMPNDVLETLDAFQLHARVQAKLYTGEIKQIHIDRIKNDKTGKAYLTIPNGELIRDWNKATYGAGGATFLGPNAPVVLGAYEMITRANLDNKVDPTTENAFDTSYNQLKKDNKKWFGTGFTVQETYDFLNKINSQLARSVAYTFPGVPEGSSFIDAAQLELGLFPSKPQREMNKTIMSAIFGKKKDKRKKQDLLKANTSKRRLRAAMRSLDKIERG